MRRLLLIAKEEKNNSTGSAGSKIQLSYQQSSSFIVESINAFLDPAAQSTPANLDGL